MDSHALEYFSQYIDETSHGHFHKVVTLHDEKKLKWTAALKLCPTLPRGWFELAHLNSQDRIEFIHAFWLKKLPYKTCLPKALDNFFSNLDDIGIFLVQNTNDEPFIPIMVYSLSDNGGFFKANAPAFENQIINLQKDFSEYILPVDYVAFLQMHNGFAKFTDTGILPTTEIKENYVAFQTMLGGQDPIVTSTGAVVDPKTLIPFYKSFGMPFFQCFWGEWYPENEMGNVYYSGQTNTISDCNKSDFQVETMAFETFVDWLSFYLEKIG